MELYSRVLFDLYQYELQEGLYYDCDHPILDETILVIAEYILENNSCSFGECYDSIYW